ncbi:nucleoside-diphosphate sugar epimerase/dehydratase [Roseobacter sp. HKCCD5988]|uniref:nucleoside-diphosphate sugar epimerase/dehydratase n=1 Tax=Roseobacter sp. HKCCD5988 TaxID=3120338 RepID=UPI0030EDFFEE
MRTLLWFKSYFLGIPRQFKRFIQIALDTICIYFSFWLLMALRLDGISTKLTAGLLIIATVVWVLTLATQAILGLYKNVVRYIADKAFYSIFVSSLISLITALLLNHIYDLFVPRSVIVVGCILFAGFEILYRVMFRAIFLSLSGQKKVRVLVYGNKGIPEVVSALRQSKTYTPSVVICDEKGFESGLIYGVPVRSPSDLSNAVKDHSIEIAVFTADDINANQSRKILSELVSLGITVRTPPSLDEMIIKNDIVADWKRLSIEDLVQREQLVTIPELLDGSIKGRRILVTGAGGTIGSELCKVILEHNPTTLVLLDHSEFALYRVSETILSAMPNIKNYTDVVFKLGSVTNRPLVSKCISENRIDTIIHAAAYKHVPIVEANPLIGACTNIVGTSILASEAAKLGVSNFTLISTDKAVNPTNVMGATKRFAELITQFYSEKYPTTKFCSVRFGNVMGSSGSVIPKFEEQLKYGGPLTVTHPDITRYFMTKEEAAALVLQANALPETGHIYVLKMGDPVKIASVARSLALVNGYSTYTSDGGFKHQNLVKIKFTGLRPGEKLHEELFLDPAPADTQHPMIKRETFQLPNLAGFSKWEQDAIDAIEQDNTDSLLDILKNAPLNFVKSES